MENFIAYLIIMGSVACGIIIGNLITTAIQVKIFTGKRFIKKLMKRSYKPVMKESMKMIHQLNNLDD